MNKIIGFIFVLVLFSMANSNDAIAEDTEPIIQPVVEAPEKEPSLLELLEDRSDIPEPVAKFCSKVLMDEESPGWKAEIVRQVISRGVFESFKADMTVYSTSYAVDPYSGGSKAAWKGIPLRWGHVAADWTHIKRNGLYFPYSKHGKYRMPGTAIYLGAPVDQLVIIVDNGGAIKGKNRLDLCVPGAKAYRSFCKQVSKKLIPAYVLGEVSLKNAR